MCAVDKDVFQQSRWCIWSVKRNLFLLGHNYHIFLILARKWGRGHLAAIKPSYRFSKGVQDYISFHLHFTFVESTVLGGKHWETPQIWWLADGLSSKFLGDVQTLDQRWNFMSVATNNALRTFNTQIWGVFTFHPQLTVTAADWWGFFCLSFKVWQHWMFMVVVWQNIRDALGCSSINQGAKCLVCN